MTNLLLRLFVKNHRQVDDPAVRSAVGRLAGLTGIVCNTLLFLGKLIVGIIAGSVSIIADAVNNLSDASSSVVTLLGFRMARQPADAEHPYGHARYEYLSGLVVAALILIIGAELAKSSVMKILHPAAVEFTLFTFIVLLASVSVKLWMMSFFGALGKKIRSTTLKATSVDSRNDVIASSAVLLGCLAQYFFHVNIDGIIGLAVALFILYSGVNIARETISPLLGKQADAELIENLSRLVLSREKVLGIHDLLVHDYGPGQCYATVHAEVSAEEDPLACHDMIDAIESEAMEKLRVNLVIHYDPVVLDDEERNAALDVVTEVITGIHPDLSIHDFRLVRGAHRTKLVFDLAVPYDMETPHKELKERIDAVLKEKGLDYETIVHFDGKA